MKDAKTVLVLLGLLAFIAYVLRAFLGRVSAFFFTSIDGFLLISHSIPPVLMWMCLGLLLGLLLGSLVAIKKYKLDYKLLIYPLIAILLLLALIYGLSRYARKHEDPSDGKTNPPRATQSTGKSTVKGFDENLAKGIQAVKNEEYEEATIFFKLANKLDPKDSRIDSLATLYVQIGNEKCTLYRKRKNLRYIPNAYYKYVAALKNNKPKICK